MSIAEIVFFVSSFIFLATVDSIVNPNDYILHNNLKYYMMGRFSRVTKEELEEIHKLCGYRKIPNKKTNKIFDLLQNLTAGPHEFPWHVTFMKIGKTGGEAAICAGALLSRRHVLTASHCLIDPCDTYAPPFRWSVEYKYDRVTMGSSNLNTGGFTTRIIAQSAGKVACGAGKSNDIGVFEIDPPVPEDQFKKRIASPICLPTSETAVKRGSQKLLVAGYGYDPQEKDLPGILRYTTLTLQNNETCYKKSDKRDPLGWDTICTSATIADVCGGDSGGVLFQKKVRSRRRYEAIGIISHGRNCFRNYQDIKNVINHSFGWKKLNRSEKIKKIRTKHPNDWAAFTDVRKHLDLIERITGITP